MQRIPEPELMNDAGQAQAYSEADFAEPHEQFVTLFSETFPDWQGSGAVLDLGCGPADVLVRFARAFPQTTMTGIDGAQAMLDFGLERIAREGMTDRVRLERCLLPVPDWTLGYFPVVISNSLLHHLHQPQVLWQTLKQCARPETRVFIMDLMRPASREQAQALVDDYASGEPDILREDFSNSLLAAFTPDEVRAQLAEAGISGLSVKPVSDRHLIIRGRPAWTHRQSPVAARPHRE